MFGHRDAPWELLPLVEAEIERHITELGVPEFVVGNYGEFDRIAARAIAEVKKRYPEVIATLLLAYHPWERPVQLPKDFNGSFYPPNMEYTPRRFAIVQANRYMAVNADYIIAYAWQTASNGRALVEYARRKQIAVSNLGENGKSPILFTNYT